LPVIAFTIAISMLDHLLPAALFPRVAASNLAK